MRLSEALEVAIRRPARWPAGFAYQLLTLGWALGVALAAALFVRIIQAEAARVLGLEALRATPALDLLLGLPWARPSLVVLAASLWLAPGLARSFFLGRGVVPAEPALRSGRGAVAATAGLGAQVVLTMVAASLATMLAFAAVLSLLQVDLHGPVPRVVFGAGLGFLGVYGATLGALQHLALASLVRHRRGAGSAFLHAWRLVRSQPAGAARAVVLDLALFGAAYGAIALLDAWVPSLGFGGLTALAVLALCGLARAGFWSRTYHALGGVEPVPETGPAAAAPRHP